MARTLANLIASLVLFMFLFLLVTLALPARANCVESRPDVAGPVVGPQP